MEGEAAGRLTIYSGLFLGEIVYDGFARGLWVWSRVPMLLKLLLRHQVCPQLSVQCGSYSKREEKRGGVYPRNNWAFENTVCNRKPLKKNLIAAPSEYVT